MRVSLVLFDYQMSVAEPVTRDTNRQNWEIEGPTRAGPS